MSENSDGIQRSRRRNKREIEDELIEISHNHGGEMLDRFVSMKQTNKFQCAVVSHGKFDMFPDHVLKGRWCHKCKGIFGIDLENFCECETIKCLSKEYINARTPLQWECLVCGHRWFATVNNIKEKKGCPACNGKPHYDIGLAKDIAYLRNSEILSEDYKNVKTPIRAKCGKCKNKFMSCLDDLRKGKWCECDSSPLDYSKILNLLQDLQQELIYEPKMTTRIYFGLKCYSCKAIHFATIDEINATHFRCKCELSPIIYKCRLWLDKHGVEYKTNVILDENFYNFEIKKDGNKYLLSLDNKEIFDSDKIKEIDEAKYAFNNNHYQIRIDYTQFSHINYHLEKAFTFNNVIYLSIPDKYNWIYENLSLVLIKLS